MTDQQTPSVAIMVAAFIQEEAGKIALKALEDGRENKRVFFDAAAVISQGADGDVHYSETDDMTTGKGAGWGALVGGVIGILGGPAGIAAGAGAGALIGGIAAHGDAGFADESLKQLGSALNPATSAVITVNNAEFLETIRKDVNQENLQATIAHLSKEISAALNDGKDIARYVIVSEDGVILEDAPADNDTIRVLVSGLEKSGIPVPNISKKSEIFKL